MEALINTCYRLLENVDQAFSRNLEKEINWNSRLIAIKGGRGVGKTTLLLKHIKEANCTVNECIYASLDHLYFSTNSIFQLAEDFDKKGGKYLFLDEVHKYPNWSQEIKNIYDSFPKMKVVFTSSSILEILKGNADLSRRVIIYELSGLSFREFIQIETGKSFKVSCIEDIVENHVSIASQIISKIKPLVYFENYLKYGYYPYFLEGKDTYHQRLMNVINLVIDTDLLQCRNVEPKYLPKLKKLLYLIAVSSPIQPNISKLSTMIETSRNTVSQYLEYLGDAQLLHLLKSPDKGYSILSKPEKIYLHNTNISYTLAENHIDKGNLRETFFLNQVSVKHKVEYPEAGDFIVDGKFTFEVGGKSKSKKQIKNIENSFVVADDIEIGYGNKIPLWLFGFIY